MITDNHIGQYLTFRCETCREPINLSAPDCKTHYLNIHFTSYDMTITVCPHSFLVKADGSDLMTFDTYDEAREFLDIYKED